MRGFLERRPELRRIAIVGEISEWKPQPNGNLYFNLKDDRAVLRCFAFRNETRSFPDVCDGAAVIATGSIGIWERRSEYQLRVFEIAPFGVGAIAAKVEMLRQRLQAEGIFDQARKRTFPRFPRRVALVSARGKGAADFESTLRERAPNVTTIFVETRVQGEGAELDIADALERASRENVDAVVVLRGGGSYEDRYPFNTEVVVRAIVRSRHPVVTAIGHTGDHHLADAVADAVFKTPTAAAEYIAGSWSEVATRLMHQRVRLARAIDSAIVRAYQRRDAVRGDLERAGLRVVAAKRALLSDRIARLERLSPERKLADARTRLAHGRGRLNAAAAKACRAENAGMDPTADIARPCRHGRTNPRRERPRTPPSRTRPVRSLSAAFPRLRHRHQRRNGRTRRVVVARGRSHPSTARARDARRPRGIGLRP